MNNTHRYVHGDVFIRHIEWRGEQLQQLLGKLLDGRNVIALRKIDGELITTDTGDVAVVVTDGFQALGDEDEQLIGLVMAKAVIDVSKLIDANQEQAAMQRWQLVTAVYHAFATVNLGQRIVDELLAQRFK